MPKDEGYQGSTNWETWDVELWVDNEELLYLNKRETLAMQGDEPVTGNVVQRFVRTFTGWFSNGTPDMDDASEMDVVDWEDIAVGWEEERKDMRR